MENDLGLLIFVSAMLPIFPCFIHMLGILTSRNKLVENKTTESNKRFSWSTCGGMPSITCKCGGI